MTNIDTKPDADILSIDTALTDKDRDYYQSIYKLHHKDLCNFVRRLLGSEGEVMDVVQSVYVRLVRQNKPYKLEQNPRAYLFTIATNLVRDNIRRENMRKEVADGQRYIDEELTSVSSNPEEHTHLHQRLSLLERAVARLPEKQRDILLLNRIHHLTCQQIADKRGIPLRSVQRYLSDALVRCQSLV
ncbi:RNA polymerase sigma factor [Marinibactrum halimedae]|uniref:DNA-directed RNA polymerase sigma-70 factor n=1 Tax=Marinibactrum halimedae TaxID=1444977 RepID=A0AA37TAA3_9GAMM|nr:RNA polymerase sigma factor [Marinibactrum halimedae]MCD9458840.1 RNA polymerase sigma factor [Marinibactrum halimedae]GLS27692.1 DNA-directed RNA polymerase sigma-70 factor [Marinibactrum halimedae]